METSGSRRVLFFALTTLLLLGSAVFLSTYKLEVTRQELYTQQVEEIAATVDVQRLLHDRENLLAMQKEIVPDLVPAGVECKKVKRCDTHKICAIICESGSVVISGKAQRALRLQRKLSYRRNFCTAQLPGTHNSAITIADGYGVEDHIYEGYLEYFAWFKKGMHVQTNNQVLSLHDQLRLGVRFLELDVHWFDHELRIAHCGGFHSSLIDNFVKAINIIAELVGSSIEWDSGTIGCKPSLSSIPTSEQRPVSEALKEIASWIHDPANADEFVIVFFDDEANLMQWKKVAALIKHIKTYFHLQEVLTPADVQFQPAWPSFQELLALGKRVVFLSGADYAAGGGSELLFLKGTVCDWREPAMPFLAFPICRFDKTQDGPADEVMTIFRPETSEIEYGFLNADGHVGPNEHLLNETTLPPLMECGVNIPSPDNMTPKRMESLVWTFPVNGTQPAADKCVMLERGKTSWTTVDCRRKNVVAACGKDEAAQHWQLTSDAVEEAQAEKACSDRSLLYTVPTSGFENRYLVEMLRRAPGHVEGVWINAKELVEEVYFSTDQIAVE